MNILFYIEPWIEKARPEWKDVWIEAVLQPLYRAMREFEDRRFFFLLGDAQQRAAEKLRQEPGTQAAIIGQRELKRIFPDDLTASLAWYRGMAGAERQAAMQALILQKLDGFVPDIVISFMMPVPFLRQLFPHALVLHQEVGGFSRAPYPAAWHLDPCGMFAQNFVTRFADELLARELTPAGQDFLRGFRRKFCDELLVAKNPFAREELLDGKPLRHLLLLPLQISDYIAFEGCCGFASQWDMLTHVLDHVRPDIGVVVTEHSDWGRMLTPAANAYLRQTYPHYIYSERFEDFEYPSQYLLAHVDAVATVSSSVGVQGLLWRKPVCALGQSHINVMADLTDIAQLGACLDSGAYRDKDNLLHFLLTRYYFMGSPRYLWNAAWLEPRLRQWVAQYRTRGIDADFFPPIDDDAALLEAYAEAAYPHIPLISREQVRRTSEQQALREAQNALLRQQESCQALQAELDALKNSTSWRVTEPLRRIKRGIS